MRKQKEVNLKKQVMDRIESGEVKMKPKIYFVLGSLLTIAGVVGSMISILYLSALGRFLLRTHGPRGEYRWNELVSSLPIWFVPVAVLSTILGIVLLKRFDFSYRQNSLTVFLAIIFSLILISYTMNVLGLDEVLFRQQGSGAGQFRKMIVP